MTDDLIRDSAERLFARAATSATEGRALWQAVEDAGFPLALLAEDEGGFGLTLPEAMAPLRIAARHGLGLPLAETMLAHWALARAGQSPGEGRGAVLTALADPVPWGRDLDWLLLVEEGGAFLFRGATCRWEEGQAISGEPLDRLIGRPEGGTPLALPLSPLQLKAAMAALRANQIAGALEGVLRLSLDYAGNRMQFGRSLSKFQVIQQYLAVMAGQNAAARAAAEMAAEALADPDHLVPLAAAAKIRAGEAAGSVAELAHQIHGAIGFSQEYPLHPLTRRLWVWRDLDGTEAEWARHLADHLADRPGTALWPKITELQARAF